VLSSGDCERVTEWSLLLRGSPLRWSQTERIDPELRSVQFRLLDGEPKSIDGSWSVSAAGPAAAKVEIDIEVNFGLPRIASVFDVMVAETLTSVLRGIAQSAASAARPGE
jgi:ribosome-associated toxin RatA of RatAB toxin-antitoxin module